MILELLGRICKSLEDQYIPYMVSGSLALNVYSIPRMTRDIDIVVELYEQGVDRFVTLFPDSYYNKKTIIEEVRRQGFFNIIDHPTGFKIDFIVKKDTEYQKLAFARKVRVNEPGTGFWVISIEDLIIAKLAWIQQLQSDTQLSDIENLLLNRDRDTDYIRKWIEELDLKTFDLPL